MPRTSAISPLTCIIYNPRLGIHCIPTKRKVVLQSNDRKRWVSATVRDFAIPMEGKPFPLRLMSRPKPGYPSEVPGGEKP